MDEVLMEVWVEELWLKNVREVSKQLGFDNSLLICDAFSARQDMVDRVEEAYKLISSDKDMVSAHLMYAGSPCRILQKLEVDLSTRNACVMRKAS